MSGRLERLCAGIAKRKQHESWVAAGRPRPPAAAAYALAPYTTLMPIEPVRSEHGLHARPQVQTAYQYIAGGWIRGYAFNMADEARVAVDLDVTHLDGREVAMSFWLGRAHAQDGTLLLGEQRSAMDPIGTGFISRLECLQPYIVRVNVTQRELRPFYNEYMQVPYEE